MQPDRNSSWEANPNWNTPCGRSLKKLIGTLNKEFAEPISVVLTSGSWFQMMVDPQEPTKDLDIMLLRNDGEGGLDPILPRESEPILEKAGLSQKTSGSEPYVDVLPPDSILVSDGSLDRMSHSIHKNVRLSIQHSSDWLAMHTPSILNKNNRIQRLLESSISPTKAQYRKAVSDLGKKSVRRQYFSDEIFYTSLTKEDVKRVEDQMDQIENP